MNEAVVLELLHSANFRDLQGHCRCLQWDCMRTCSRAQCYLYHHGVDCPSFCADGVCTEKTHQVVSSQNDATSNSASTNVDNAGSARSDAPSNANNAGNSLGKAENAKTCDLRHDVEKHRYSTRHPLRRDIAPEIVSLWQEVKEHTSQNEIAFDSVVKTLEMLSHWKKICEADRAMKLDFVPIVSFILYYADKTKKNDGFQVLERLLRQHRMNTWLIARGTAPEGMQIANDLPFYLFASVRFPEHALKELRVESATYRENFDKLAQCGILTKNE